MGYKYNNTKCLHCDELAVAKEMCMHHYYESRRGPKQYTINKNTNCLYCDSEAVTKNMCDMHYVRYKKYGDPYFKKDTTNPNITYGGMHVRLKKKRGKAIEHKCVGCQGNAAHWALINGKATHYGTDKRGYLLKWSTNIYDYIPLCTYCHSKYDNS